MYCRSFQRVKKLILRHFWRENEAFDTTPQSTDVPYLDHGEPENEPIEKVYVTTLVTPMGLFNYVDGINSKITPKK